MEPAKPSLPPATINTRPDKVLSQKVIISLLAVLAVDNFFI